MKKLLRYFFVLAFAFLVGFIAFTQTRNRLRPRADYSLTIPGPGGRISILKPTEFFYLHQDDARVTKTAAGYWSQFTLFSRALTKDDTEELIANGAVASPSLIESLTTRPEIAEENQFDTSEFSNQPITDFIELGITSGSVATEIYLLDVQSRELKGPWLIPNFDLVRAADSERGFLPDGRLVICNSTEEGDRFLFEEYDEPLQDEPILLAHLIDPNRPDAIVEHKFPTLENHAWMRRCSTDFSTLAASFSNDNRLVIRFFDLADGTLRSEFVHPYERLSNTEDNTVGRGRWALSNNGDKCTISLADWEDSKLLGQRAIQVIATDDSSTLAMLTEIGKPPEKPKDSIGTIAEVKTWSKDWWPCDPEFTFDDEAIVFEAGRMRLARLVGDDQPFWTMDTGDELRQINLQTKSLEQVDEDFGFRHKYFPIPSLDGDYQMQFIGAKIQVFDKDRECVCDLLPFDEGELCAAYFVPNQTAVVMNWKESIPGLIQRFTTLLDGFIEESEQIKDHLRWYDWTTKQGFDFFAENEREFEVFCQPENICVLSRPSGETSENGDPTRIDIWQTPPKPMNNPMRFIWPIIAGLAGFIATVWLLSCLVKRRRTSALRKFRPSIQAQNASE